MIQINISENQIENSKKMEELSSYLKKKGHQVSCNRELIEDAKADMITWITLAFTGWAALYPTIKDLQNWVRPKRYTISITDRNVTVTANELTEEEFLEVTKKLNKDKTKIEVTK
ncbi:hypothetical protein [Aliarcobacter cryaerophilus]|uniref:hypothetical protein n=1 Tax=Aliarcobacter cryaerophilus TaxID=28198 RepID=UPI0008341A63|nr:hypothetical protein [Aliarcobacter cryaerophilus]